MVNKCLIILLLFMCSCKSHWPLRTNTHYVQPAPAGPMNCGITGKIIRIIPTKDIDTGSLCAKYNCKAVVQIMEAPSCGSGVSMPLSPGDTVEMKFTFTLHSTRGLFSNMQTEYPGLKTSDEFTASAEQRLSPGGPGVWVVNGYNKK